MRRVEQIMKLKDNDMKKGIFSPLLLAAVLIGVVMTSCTKEGELLSTIPANARAVAVVDVKGVLEASGCKFTAEGVALPASINDEADDNELLAAIGKLDAAGVCSFNEVAVVLDRNSRTTVTFLVSDGDKFKELTPEFGWKDGLDGYDEGKVSGEVILTDGKQAWIMLDGDAYAVANDLKEDAKKEPVTKLSGIKEALEGDNLVNAAFSGLDFGTAAGKDGKKEATWNVMTANVKDNKLVASSRSMKGNGEAVAVKGMQHVDPAVLSYIPDNCNIVAAAGFTKEFDWQGAVTALTPFIVRDFQMQGAVAMLTPFLQSLDGTVILAAGPANEEAYEDMEPENWQFVMMARISQDKIDQVMNMVRTSMAQAGISPIEDGNGVIVIPQYGMNFYIGNVDGYLAVSNIPFEKDRRNTLAPLVDGKDAAAGIEIPSLSVFSTGAPAYGIKLTVSMEGAEGDAELSLPGSTAPILEAIFTAFYD